MAIDIKFDLAGNPEPPTIILATRSGQKLGQLEVEPESIDLSDKFNDASEISFTLNKYYFDEEEKIEKVTNLWDKVVNFKLVWCKEWDMWFEITVELDEETETIKTVFCKQLGQAELSQIMLYNIEINTEEDIERDDYKISILYDENDPEASILNRLLNDKAPHYRIIHVDPTIAKIQRMFSFDDISIYDAFQEMSEEIGCLFVYHSDTDENGKIRRAISVYDLQQNCNECGYRGEYTNTCTKCGSINIDEGYGEDTLIFVTADELASDGIQLTTDTDSVKNCFKLEAGDDLMTATIRNCNPNGTDYIWYLSDMVKEDMSKELVDKIESYNETYNMYQDSYKSPLDTELINKYNELVNKYSVYNDELEQIKTPVIGYPSLMNAYYNTIDLAMYLQSSLMPTVKMSDTSAEIEANKLTVKNLSPVSVNSIADISVTTASNAVLSMAKIIVDSRYRVKVETSSLERGEFYQIWTGNFTVTNYSDEEDKATSKIVEIIVDDNYSAFVKQKIEKALNKDDTDDLSISGLFKKDYDEFVLELKKYSLNCLSSFYNSCQSCIDILIEQGIADKNTWSGQEPNLYEDLYVPYLQKMSAIEAETKIRQEEIDLIIGVYDVNNELKTYGLQNYIFDIKSDIQNELDFKEYLGYNLWLEFCTFRRESKFSNDNYISDGLDNAQLFKNALEFIEVANNEIYKSAELQHSITTTLNNLLAIPKFKPLVKSFKTGNWIRVQINDEIYKLRLLDYDISYGDFNNIPVIFSDVIKVKSGITDVQNILSQASSMATSYDSVKRQANQGNEAKNTIAQWISDGLNSSLVQIQNNDSEDITMTKNGLLCRSYDDITETYSPKQLKLTHNIMAYTDDNWNSVRLAIGEYEYVSYDTNIDDFVDKIGYGIGADFVNAGVVSGSQIIGGDIYSDNYSLTNGTGSYLNLRDGTFSFAGGSLRYEGGKLLISSPDVPTTEQITEINEEYLKTTSIYAQNLKINSANINGELTIGQLPDSVAKTDDIPTKISQLTNDSGYQTKTGVTTIVNGVVTTDFVNALKVTAGSVAAENITGTTITGKTIQSGSFVGGSINIGDGNFIVNSKGHCTAENIRANKIQSVDNVTFNAEDVENGGIYTNANMFAERNISCNGSMYTGGDLTVMNNASVHGTLWTESGTVDSSDRDVKNSIETLNYKETAKFIYSLTPRRYKYNSGESDRYHHGLIAQELKESMYDDWGVYVDNSIAGNGHKGIRYQELIADLIAVVQTQNERIIKLESSNNKVD